MSRARPRRPRCPVCGSPVSAERRPFCSTRCRDVDLGRWLAGGYRIPADETPDAEDLEQALDESDSGDKSRP